MNKRTIEQNTAYTFVALTDYWSSTEANINNAGIVFFGTGGENYDKKTRDNYVRCVMEW